ncbi:heavy metal-associated domain-containing protein [Mesonia sp. MT50]|jgi:copper chaperone CopZ|uniref:Heavy-metal-associated domain-containing protein n=2 Tax=Bacteroidota TaxID=976 RepID=A0A1I6UWL0_9SPHI|nr:MULTISPECIES: heavy metal-associated domain-containing protein [Bacteroidota]MDQ7918013.1 heavy metal-associated domain-containing protein [Mesonia profundi]MDY0370271.1 heavy metal-associated domain-containing protein [Bacteroidales bacterium]SFT05795.1 Heavy-metal-associated domain-containing protein [Sphingobacterium wenxiniae]
MKTIRIQLETLTCPSCINKIEGVLNKQTGVDEAKVMFNSSKVKITYNEEETNPEEISAIIEKLGYPVLS